VIAARWQPHSSSDWKRSQVVGAVLAGHDGSTLLGQFLEVDDQIGGVGGVEHGERLIQDQGRGLAGHDGG